MKKKKKQQKNPSEILLTIITLAYTEFLRKRDPSTSTPTLFSVSYSLFTTFVFSHLLHSSLNFSHTRCLQPKCAAL